MQPCGFVVSVSFLRMSSSVRLVSTLRAAILQMLSVSINLDSDADVHKSVSTRMYLKPTTFWEETIGTWGRARRRMMGMRMVVIILRGNLSWKNPKKLESWRRVVGWCGLVTDWSKLWIRIRMDANSVIKNQVNAGQNGWSMLAVTTAAFQHSNSTSTSVSSDQYTLRYHLVRGAKIRFTQIKILGMLILSRMIVYK